MENATKQFAEVQSAYEVLSDPQERAWYDSHSDTILRNNSSSGGYSENDIRFTTASDIIAVMGRFTRFVPYNDASNGFYGGLRVTFETLAKEEDLASEQEGLEVVQYPDFGGSGDSYEDVVRPFYAAWIGFSTKKTFSWMDIYKYAEAPDRRIRRLMEKENKRLRDEGIREFNDAVRTLVAFVRKRDPRFVPNTRSEAERQKLLRGAAAAQAARSRAANQARIDEQVVPEWMKMHEPEEETPSESEASDEERYECFTCGKIFKSERQYEMHEKSKKHIKTVQQLKRRIEKENKLLKLENDAVSMTEATAKSALKDDLSVRTSKRVSHQNGSVIFEDISTSDTRLNLASISHTERAEEDAAGIKIDSEPTVGLEATSETQSTSGDELDEVSSQREEVETLLSGLTVVDNPHLNHNDEPKGDAFDQLASNTYAFSVTSNSNNNGGKFEKISKAKVKRAKKFSQHNASDTTASITLYSF